MIDKIEAEIEQNQRLFPEGRDKDIILSNLNLCLKWAKEDKAKNDKKLEELKQRLKNHPHMFENRRCGFCEIIEKAFHGGKDEN